MTSLNGSDERFTDVWSEELQLAVDRLGTHAVALGIGMRVSSALGKIRRRLRTDPWNFGEAEFNYKSLKLVEHLAIVPPLVVHYAVHLEQPFVFLKTLAGLAGSGLED